MKRLCLVILLLLAPAGLGQGTGQITNSPPAAELSEALVAPTFDQVTWRLTDPNGITDLRAAHLEIDDQAMETWTPEQPFAASPSKQPGWIAWDPTPGDGSLLLAYRQPATPHADKSTWNFTVEDESSRTPAISTLLTRTNTAPVAADDAYMVMMNRTLTVPAARGVLANDVDVHPLNARLTHQQAAGKINLDGDGSFTYKPTRPGHFHFDYEVTDGDKVATATVRLTVPDSARSTSMTLPRETIEATTGGTLLRLTLPNGDDTGSLQSIVFKDTSSSKADAVIDMAAILQTRGAEKVVKIMRPLEIARVDSAFSVAVQFPAGATISSSDTWNGDFVAPTIQPADASRGERLVIKIGRNDGDLQLSEAVPIRIAGQAGMQIQMESGAGKELLTICSAAKPTSGACQEDDGDALVVWTTHFSIFRVLAPGFDGGEGSPATSDASGWCWLWALLVLPLLVGIFGFAAWRRKRRMRAGPEVVIG